MGILVQHWIQTFGEGAITWSDQTSFMLVFGKDKKLTFWRKVVLCFVVVRFILTKRTEKPHGVLRPAPVPAPTPSGGSVPSPSAPVGKTNSKANGAKV